MNLNRAIEQALHSWKRAGLSEFPQTSGEALLETLKKRSLKAAPRENTAPREEKFQQPSRMEVSVPNTLQEKPQKTPSLERESSSHSDQLQESGSTEMTIAERKSRLSTLSEQVAACQKCSELAQNRTQTVFGVGKPNAKIMFIGEAPGADEDKQGEPFVGRAGKLLNTIIEACGWKREELYICNILRCRPTGNRNPTPIEAGNCREFLDAQIEIVKPKYIVCWGTIAAQNLLSLATPIGRMRGSFYEYGKAKVLCTYHPAYLLRNPPAKKYVWEDLKILLRDMGIDPDELSKKK